MPGRQLVRPTNRLWAESRTRLCASLYVRLDPSHWKRLNIQRALIYFITEWNENPRSRSQLQDSQRITCCTAECTASEKTNWKDIAVSFWTQVHAGGAPGSVVSRCRAPEPQHWRSDTLDKCTKEHDYMYLSLPYHHTRRVQWHKQESPDACHAWIKAPIRSQEDKCLCRWFCNRQEKRS